MAVLVSWIRFQNVYVGVARYQMNGQISIGLRLSVSKYLEIIFSLFEILIMFIFIANKHNTMQRIQFLLSVITNLIMFSSYIEKTITNKMVQISYITVLK